MTSKLRLAAIAAGFFFCFSLSLLSAEPAAPAGNGGAPAIGVAQANGSAPAGNAAQGNGSAPEPLVAERETSYPNGIAEVRFNSGLTLLVQENYAAPVVSTYVFVRAGSIYEDALMGSGISHYFEHIIHGGSTSKRSEAANRQMLQDIGNNSNAYTTPSATAFFITTEAKRMNEAVGLLGDFMGNCAISQAEFDRERGVIIQEIKRDNDQPGRTVSELLAEAMFPNHPAGQPVIGHEELFVQITRDQVADYYKKYYAANNSVVVVAGAVSKADAIEAVSKSFAVYPRKMVNHPVLPPAPRQTGAKWAEKRQAGLGQTYLSVGHHTVDITHPDLYALDIMADILGDGRASRLYVALREQGVVQQVYAYSHTPGYDAGVLGVGAVLDDKKVSEALSILVKELNRIKQEPVSQAEIDRAVRKKVSSAIFGRETAEDRAQEIGWDYITTGNPSFTANYLEKLRSVTPADIQRVANQYLTDENRTVALLRPEVPVSDKGDKGITGQPAAAQVEKITLSNGVRLLYGKDPKVKSVLVQATFLGGVLAETKDNNGICQLMTTMLLQGTQKRDKRAFHEALEDMGAEISGNSGNNSWQVNIKLLAEDLERGAEALAEAVVTPRFAEEDFNRERARQLHAIKAMSDDDAAASDRFFRRGYFGENHPYSLHPLGGDASVSKLSRADVEAFHKMLLNPSSCVIAVFGNVEREVVVKTTEKLFGAIPAAQPWKPAPTTFVRNANSFAASASAKEQIYITMGFRGVPFGGEDTPALAVLDTIISGYGYPSGWLHEGLRGERDLVYMVHAYNWAGIGVGVFEIVTQTSTENVPSVMSTIDAVLERARTKPFSITEVDAAKESIIISEAIENESPGARATRASYDELYGLGFRFHDDFARKVREVTPEQVSKLAQEYLTSGFVSACGQKEGVAAVGKHVEARATKPAAAKAAPAAGKSATTAK